MTPTLTVSEFIAVFNQSMQMILPEVNVRGELANLRISKNRWVYFDLKDEESSLKFFGPVTVLPGPLEDGMNLEVNGTPRLHNLYGFSVNAHALKVVGEGSIAKAKNLLVKKLEAEGLFRQERKRQLPYPPSRIALVTSTESAAYSDFIKVINQRWGNITVEVMDCLVQGNSAPGQIIRAISYVSQMADPPEVLVLIRGGGSEDDLSAFSDERVVRAVSASRIPALVAIGHERDISLAELAADQRASTPSNAAEMLVPDIRHEKSSQEQSQRAIGVKMRNILEEKRRDNKQTFDYLGQKLNTKLEQEWVNIKQKINLLKALDPKMPLRRGYALVRNISQERVRSVKNVSISQELFIELIDGKLTSKVVKIDEGK